MIAIIANIWSMERHISNFNNSEILDNESNYNKRIISEMINMKLEDNSMNKKTDTQNGSVIYENLSNKYKHRKKITGWQLMILGSRSSERRLTFN